MILKGLYSLGIDNASFGWINACDELLTFIQVLRTFHVFFHYCGLMLSQGGLFKSRAVM